MTVKAGSVVRPPMNAVATRAGNGRKCAIPQNSDWAITSRPKTLRRP